MDRVGGTGGVGIGFAILGPFLTSTVVIVVGFRVRFCCCVRRRSYTGVTVSHAVLFSSVSLC